MGLLRGNTTNESTPRPTKGLLRLSAQEEAKKQEQINIDRAKLRDVDEPQVSSEPFTYEPPTIRRLDLPVGLRQSPVVQAAAQIEPSPPEPERPGRDIPVLGNVLRGLDVVGEKVEPVAGVLRELYTPGLGAGELTLLDRAAGGLLRKIAPGLVSSNKLGAKVATTAAKEAIVGAPAGAAQSLTQTGDLGEAAKGAAFGAALGGGLGGLGRLAGEGAETVAERASSGLLRPMLEGVTTTGKAPVESAIESAARAGKIPNKLTPVSAESQLDRVMTQVKPTVEQRLAVPYENPNELAKYVQQGLKDQGTDISLNEVRKVPYNDLVEMADELKRGANVYDEAVKAAREVGYDLPNLLEGKTPSLRERVSRDASARAAGVYPETLPKVIEPLTNAADVAPPMKQNWFTALFGDQGVGISAFGSKKRINKVPLTTEDQIVRSPLKRDVEGTWEQTKAVGRSTYQNFVDINSPLKNISREVYDKAMDAARANNIANVIVSDKFVNAQGEVIGQSLSELFKKVSRGDTKKFKDYLVLRHAKTRMERGERVYNESLAMTPEKVQERIDMLEKRYPGFGALGKEWDQFNDNILRTYGVEEGLISPELYRTLREKNPHYASMRREFTMSEKFAHPLAKGFNPAFSGQKAPIKEVSPTGSVRNIVDPSRSAIEATGAWVNAAMRNRVMQSIVQRVKSNPEAFKGIVEIVQKPKGQKNLQEILADDPNGLVESLNDDFNKLFKPTKLDDDNIVRAMVKGEPVYLKVNDPESVKALLGMGSEQSNLVMDFFGYLSNATKYGATGALAPMFAIKGLTTDIAQSIIQSKNPLQHVGDLMHAIASSLADTLPKNTPGVQGLRRMAQDFRRSGGEYSSVLRGDRPLQRNVDALKRAPLLSPQSIAKGVKNVALSPFRTLHKVSDIAENVNRMAAARGELRRLGDQRTPENVQKSMQAAREITTNFSRKGAKSQGIEKFIPYSNAAVQGMYRFAKQWRKHPIKTAALVGGAVMIPKFTEYLRFHEDEDYQKLPARERYRNLILGKNEDGTFVKVPMPPEYNALGAIVMDTLTYFRDNNPNAFKDAADAITNAYTPPLISGAAQGITQDAGIEQSLAGAANATVLAPAGAILGNKSFTGAPIVPQRLGDLSPKFQLDERTTAPAKWLGEKTGMSPMKWDYLIRAYGGDAARLLLPLTSEVGGGTPRSTLLKNFIVDPVFTNTLSNDFYGYKENLQRAYTDNKKVEAALPEWYNDELRKMVTSTAKGSVSSRLSDLSEEKRTINGDQTLSAEEKSKKLRDIQGRINDIYLDVNAQLDNAGVPRR